MKTPREILFERHQPAQPALDNIRRQVVAGLEAERSADQPVRAGERPGRPEARAARTWPGWREFLLPFRWHLAGLGAAWLVIAALSLERPVSAPAAMARQKVPSARQLMTAFRESRRQLFELIELPHLNQFRLSNRWHPRAEAKCGLLPARSPEPHP